MQITGDALRIRRDHVLEDMLKNLGATLHPVDAVFDPERGAYGHELHMTMLTIPTAIGTTTTMARTGSARGIPHLSRRREEVDIRAGARMSGEGECRRAPAWGSRPHPLRASGAQHTLPASGEGIKRICPYQRCLRQHLPLRGRSIRAADREGVTSARRKATSFPNPLPTRGEERPGRQPHSRPLPSIRMPSTLPPSIS
ncbi:MAG: hypothetical protein R3D52_05185 [Xanthobacteraceae bacterium]